MVSLQTPDSKLGLHPSLEKHSATKVVDLQTGGDFDEERLLLIIQGCHQLKEYRPVVAVVLQNSVGEVLVVQSTKPPQDWGFLQGGIDEGEKLLPSLSREAREEVALNEQEIVVKAYLGSDVLDAPQNRADKRGFTKGKIYFYFAARYTENSKFILQEEEIRDARWVSVQVAIGLFANTRQEKSDLMKKMLLSALKANMSQLE